MDWDLARHVVLRNDGGLDDTSEVLRAGRMTIDEGGWREVYKKGKVVIYLSNPRVMAWRTDNAGSNKA